MTRAKGIVLFVFCLAAVLLSMNCAATKKITQDIIGKGYGLKKKVAFLPVSNKTGYGSEASEGPAGTYFTRSLEPSCDGLVVIDSDEARRLLAEIPRLTSGHVDNLAVARLGRTLGLSMVLEQSPARVECVLEKRGIWGFRDMRPIVRLSVSVRGYDIASGAILFEEAIQKEVEVSENDCQNIKEGGGHSQEIVNQLLAEAIPELSQRACELVGNEPWKGYIVSASENTFNLSAGSDVGLAVGDILEVFGAGEPIKSNSGVSYLVSGPKIGEIKVTNVLGDRAEATGDPEKNFDKSNYVRLKQ